ncbi:MAG: hypothetical protein ACREVY_07825 [Gammaproteobacteria bacterium]
MNHPRLALGAAIIPFLYLIAGCASEDDTSSAFCPTALCAPGTQCNEETRSCEKLPEFCPTALCPPGTQCNEQARRCE